MIGEQQKMTQHLKLSICLAILAVLAVALFACGGDNSSPGPGSAASGGPGSFADELPTPQALPRIVSADGLENTGAAFEAGLPSSGVATDNAPAADFQANWNPDGDPPAYGYAYAVYSFRIVDYDGPDTLTFSWADPAPAAEHVWIGLPDMVEADNQRWEWLHPDASNQVVMENVLHHTNDDNLLYVVVLLTTAQTHAFEGLRLGNEPPTGYYERENNDHFDYAQPLPELPFTGATVTGSIGAAEGYDGYDGDQYDWYSFTVPDSAVLSIDVGFTPGADGSAFDFAVYRSDGSGGVSQLYESTGNTAGFSHELESGVDAAGEYMVRFAAEAENGGDYTLGLDYDHGAYIYYESEDNDSWLDADNLPGLPFGTTEVNCSLGTEDGYPGYDGDQTDWFEFATAASGMVDFTVNMDSMLGSGALTLNIHRYLFAEETPTQWRTLTFDTTGTQTLFCPFGGSYWIEVVAPAGLYGDYGLGLSFTNKFVDETEDNDDDANADALPAYPVEYGDWLASVGDTDTPENGELIVDGDNADWYQVGTPFASPFIVTIYEEQDDLDFEIYDTDGSTVLASLTGDHDPEQLVFLLDEMGTYYLRVFPGTGGGHSMYFVAIDNNIDGYGWFDGEGIDGAGDDIGQQLDMAMVNGNPAVAYYDASNQALMFARATDPNGVGWSDPVVVDGDAVAGTYLALELVDGNPAIAYQTERDPGGGTEWKVEYIRASDLNGMIWPATSVEVDTSTSNLGSGLDLVMADGRPAVAYHGESAGQQLYFLRANDSLGATWTAGDRVEVAAATAGDVCEMLIIDGNPAVAYTDDTEALNYTRADDATGMGTWAAPSVLWEASTAPGADDTVSYASLAVVNSNPAVAFTSTDGSNTSVRYIRGANAQGSSWGSFKDIVADGTADYPDLAFLNDVPTVVYRSTAGGDSGLRYVQSTDLLGTFWGDAEVPDDGADTGYFPQVGYASGRPMVFSRDAANGDIRFAVKY
jgi:hypothetical protein